MSEQVTDYDVEAIRADFPVLDRVLAQGRGLVYLDSANTSQKPQVVVDAMRDHYLYHNANVARAVHQLGAEATEAFESARSLVSGFIGAHRPEEVIFTKNASEALNLVARSLSDPGPFQIGPGDEVLISEMEHHSNIVPWQMLCNRTGATLRWIPLGDDYHLDLTDTSLFNERTAVVAVTAVSNVLGTVNPVAEIVERARAVEALVVIDGAQWVPHHSLDVQAWGADFVAFTGHKMCGPTGIGVLWGRYDLLAELPPFLGGGEMIDHVTMERSTYAPPPHRFEAGTPPIAEAVGLGVAVRYLSAVGMDKIAAHGDHMTEYTLEALSAIPGLRIIGPPWPRTLNHHGNTEFFRGSAVTFTVDGVHPHDVAQVLDSEGIAIRAGHHCAKPLHQRYGIQASCRVSPYLYTTTREIDALVHALEYARKFFGVDG